MSTLVKELPAKQHAQKQRAMATGILPHRLYGLINHDHSPTDDDLLKFWSTWPSTKINCAAVFGKFFRIKPGT